MLVGVDEAGRGALAGPVVAGAVILHGFHGKLKDSKALSKDAREILAKDIKRRHIWAAAEASAKEVDSLNIHHASLLAMARAVLKLRLLKAHLLIDGRFSIPYLPKSFRQSAVIKGDAKLPAIMAAGVLAKTERDRQLKGLHLRYPVYGFHTHKGYPTERHKRALRQYGLCPFHRRSFAPVKALICK